MLLALVVLSIYILIYINTLEISATIQNDKRQKYNINFTEVGIDYLQRKNPDKIIHKFDEQVYTNPETGLTYTIMRTRYKDGNSVITISHSTSNVGGINKIDEDYQEWLSSLPQPYQKFDSALRAVIKHEFGKYPALGENIDTSVKLDVIILADNTQDLVKFTKYINELIGFPEVY